ncbi:hypothetical protein ACIQZB_31380 [Streptomyces sp. NPDC097727]|uniref:hypothetical protein n=1 Tax=Streptomyces sp. NPDC097727 TaxID=3366092 RepID=UPI00381821D2
MEEPRNRARPGRSPVPAGRTAGLAEGVVHEAGEQLLGAIAVARAVQGLPGGSGPGRP